jgi:Flp pilus assembly protein TadD
MFSSDQIDAIAVVGLNFFTQGHMQEAEVVFRGLIALDPDVFYGYAGLGALMLAQEPPNLSEARRNLEKAAALRPDNPAVHANLGEVLLRQSDFQGAAVEFDRALELDPELVDGGANRARALILGLQEYVAEAAP